MVPSIEQEIRDLHELFGSSRDPEGRAFVPLADAYRRAGDPSRALGLLTDGMERHPDLPSALLVEGLVRLDLSDPSAAEAAFARVLELDPDNARALVELGRLRSADEVADEESDALIQRGIALDPTLAGEAGLAPASAGESDEGLVERADLAPPSGLDVSDLAPESGLDVADFAPGAGLDVGDFAPEPSDVDSVAGDVAGFAGADSSASGDDVAALDIDWDLESGWEGGAGTTEADAAPSASVEPGDTEAWEAEPAAAGEQPLAEQPESEWAEPSGVEQSEAEMDPWSVPAEPEQAERLPTGEVEPDALLMGLSEVAPDLEPGRPSEDADDDPDIVPTRTLAELYARQGLVPEAIAVYEALSARDPDDLEAKARLVELREELGSDGGSAAAEAASSADSVLEEVFGALDAVESYEPLAEAGPVEATAEVNDAGPTIREDLRALLAWAPEDPAPVNGDDARDHGSFDRVEAEFDGSFDGSGS